MRLQDRFLRRLFILAAIVVVCLPWLTKGLATINPADPLAVLRPAESVQTPAANDNAPHIPQDRAKHILYGDRNGGGHLHGTGKPCKSEFPQNWDAQTVLQKIQTAATNDNAHWQQQPNGYYVADVPVDDIQIRIVLNNGQDTVITAYPVNVRRNPCPAANDNRR